MSDKATVYLITFGAVAVLLPLFLAWYAMIPWLVTRQFSKDDPEYRVIGLPFNAQMMSRDPRLPTTIIAGSLGKGRWFWDLTVQGISLGKHSTLTLDTTGAVATLQDVVGVKRIKTSDAEFDRRFTVSGSNAHILRHVFEHPELRDTVPAMFAKVPYSCHLELNGRLKVRLSRSSFEAAEARSCLAVVRAFAAALEASSAAPSAKPLAVPSVSEHA
jgi:hypothetical protein